MSAIVLGQLVDDGPLRIDIPTLVDSRALITGNSGAGKSRLLRRVVEQAFGKVQIIVLDPEGEFPTLREKHAFLLAGRGGEMPAEPRAAALMARRLMELRASAVLDLYDLKLPQRRDFVKAFLESLMELPRDQYRPVLVILDEAQMFCPERGAGEATSTEAVIALMTQGRKRGLCGIPATQRLSMLDKTAAAQANNVFVGRTTLDVDQKRAAATLGITAAAERVALRDLPLGVFLAYGPALSKTGVVRFQGGDVETTHPKAGQRHTAVAPPAPEAIRKIAAELADLPAQAAEELRTMQAAKARIRELEAELRKKPIPPAPPAPKPPKRVEVPILKADQVKRLERIAAIFERHALELEGASGTVKAAAADSRVYLREISAAIAAATNAHERAAPRIGAPAAGAMVAGSAGGGGRASALRPTGSSRPAPVVPVRAIPRHSYAPDGSAPGGGLRRMLIALAQRPGLTRRQLGVRSGVSSRGGSFDTYLSRGRTQGWIEGDSSQLTITNAGLEALGSYEELPTGAGLLDHYVRELGGGAARMLQVLAEAYPRALSRDELGEASGVSARGGSFDTYLSRIRTLELVTGGGRQPLRASDELFEEGGSR